MNSAGFAFSTSYTSSTSFERDVWGYGSDFRGRFSACLGKREGRFLRFVGVTSTAIVDVVVSLCLQGRMRDDLGERAWNLDGLIVCVSVGDERASYSMGTSRLGRRGCAEADDVDGGEEVAVLSTERKRSEGQLLPLDLQGRSTSFFLSSEPQKRLCARL